MRLLYTPVPIITAADATSMVNHKVRLLLSPVFGLVVDSRLVLFSVVVVGSVVLVLEDSAALSVSNVLSESAGLAGFGGFFGSVGSVCTVDSVVDFV